MREELYQRANEVADTLVRQVGEVRGGKGRAMERRRSFNIFRIEMRLASKGQPSVLGELGREKVKIFGDTHKTYGRSRIFRRTNDWRLS